MKRRTLALSVTIAVLAACGSKVNVPPMEAAGGAGGGTGAVTPDGGAGEGKWTVKLGPAGDPRMPGAAYSGNTLGVAATAGIREPRIVLDIDRGGTFEQHDLGLPGGWQPIGMAGTNDGFVFAAWSTSNRGGIGPGAVEVATVGLDGAVRGRISIATNIDATGCDVAHAGGVTAAACSGSIFALCNETACTFPALSSCQSAGDSRVVWDGQNFALARVCALANGQSGLRFARISSAGVVQGGEVQVAAVVTTVSRPGLIANAERAILAFAGNLFTVDRGGAVASPVPLAPPLAGWDIEHHAFEAELAQVGERLVASTCWYLYGALDGGEAESKLQVIGANLAPAGAPVLSSGGCSRMRTAVSPTGSVYVARDGYYTVAVQSLDVVGGVLGQARFFDGSPTQPSLLDLLCEGLRCRIALGIPGRTADFGVVPARMSELSFTAGSDAEAKEVGSYDECSNLDCGALFTSSGALLISNSERLRWLDPLRKEVWSAPVAAPTWLTFGLRGREHPYWGIEGEPSSSVVYLEETGLQAATPIPGHLSPCVLCDAGIFQIVGTNEGTRFRPVLRGGPGPLLAEGLPNGMATLCAGTQIGQLGFTIGATNVLQRLSLDGHRLADVTIPGQVVGSTGVGDDAYLVLTPDLDPSEPRQDFLVARVPLDGPIETHPLPLPEAGIIQKVSISGNYAFVGWLAERGLMLTAVPLQ